MKYNIFIVLLMFSIIFFSSGCQKKDITNIDDLEQDGEVYSIYPDEFTETEKETYYIKSAINDLNDDFIEYRYSNAEYVENDIYNFIVVIPIKTKSNFSAIKKGSIININGHSHLFYVSDVRVNLTDDGYYHYLSVVPSNRLAAFYYLNDIKDIEMRYDLEDSNLNEKKVIKSNKITIKAEEFEHMLDRLAISHERLSFQPDGF